MSISGMKSFRRTPQRLAIIKFLEGNTSHPSAEMIWTALQGQFPTLSLATVYNTLEALRERRMVLEVGGDDAKKRFDPFTDSHYHLICLNCKKILDIPAKYAPALTDEEKQGFSDIRGRVEFFGLCPECRSRRSATSLF
jgi:Fur family peroxide stress response transcriptional regulator